jgi:hypothetical protein
MSMELHTYTAGRRSLLVAAGREVRT